MNSTIAFAIVSGVVCALVSFLLSQFLSARRQRQEVYESTVRLGFDFEGLSKESRFSDFLSSLERAVRDLQSENFEAEALSSQLRCALDVLPTAVMIFDGEESVISSNHAAAPFLEARHGDALVGAAVTDLIKVAASGRETSTSIELFGPPRRTFEVSAVPLSGSGRPGTVAFVTDITERRQLEAIRTDLVANISHELKTPVGAIGLLAETLQGESDLSIVERLALRINTEAMRIAQIIEDLIELSRLESAAKAFTEVVNLSEIASEATEALRPAALQAGVEVLVLGSIDRTSILGERRQLLSALGNLIDNAIKYSDRNSAVKISVEDSEGFVIVRVSDNGIGIPTRDIERIFERFYRVDQGRSRQTGGTGLGLAIVRHASANHGAVIEVESRLGEGSTFTLRFPSSVSES